MLRTTLLVLAASAAVAGTVRADVPVTLVGSPASMVRQHEVAEKEGLSFLRTPAQVRALVTEGQLVPLGGNADYTVSKGVSFPDAQPATRLFVERTAASYRAACGEQMVVTSLTRPLSDQPSNAHKLSVHPTGMAADLRIPKNAACRTWLEGELLSLEKAGVIDVTREHTPPHLHVAVFGAAYTAYAAKQDAAAPPAEPGAPVSQSVSERAAGKTASSASRTADAAGTSHEARNVALALLGLAGILAFASSRSFGGGSEDGSGPWDGMLPQG
jgi:hypothetical protein